MPGSAADCSSKRAIWDGFIETGRIEIGSARALSIFGLKLLCRHRNGLLQTCAKVCHQITDNFVPGLSLQLVPERHSVRPKFFPFILGKFAAKLAFERAVACCSKFVALARLQGDVVSRLKGISAQFFRDRDRRYNLGELSASARRLRRSRIFPTHRRRAARCAPTGFPVDP